MLPILHQGLDELALDALSQLGAAGAAAAQEIRVRRADDRRTRAAITGFADRCRHIEFVEWLPHLPAADVVLWLGGSLARSLEELARARHHADGFR